MVISILRAAAFAAAVMTIAACGAPQPDTAATAEPESSVTAAPANQQVASMGATLTIKQPGSSADYTVSNLRPVPPEAQIIPAKGQMYAVDVTIDGRDGTTKYNGFYFVARDQDGSSVPPAVGAVRPGITDGELGPGQSVAGHVAFDVPAGKSIIQIALRDPKGHTMGVWAQA